MEIYWENKCWKYLNWIFINYINLITWLGFCILLQNPLNLNWFYIKIYRKFLRIPIGRNLRLHQNLPDLLRNLFQNRWIWPSGNLLPNFFRNLLRNPVLALQQNFPYFFRKFGEPNSALYRNLLGLLRDFFWNLLNLIWPCTKASRNYLEPDPALHQCLPPLLRNLFRNPIEPDLALHQSLPDLLRNPVEPDLALHQSLPDLLRNLFRILLNLTWLCTKTSHPFSGTFSGSCWTWPDSAPKPPRPSPEPFPEPSPEPSPEPCWAWPGSTPKPPRPSPDPFPDLVEPDLVLHQTLPPLFRNLFRILLNLTWLCTKASQTFSGTFSGTLLNLIWLCTKASRNLLRNLFRNLGTFSGILLNLTRRLHHCTPELFWAEDPISLRCWAII